MTICPFFFATISSLSVEMFSISRCSTCQSPPASCRLSADLLAWHRSAGSPGDSDQQRSQLLSTCRVFGRGRQLRFLFFGFEKMGLRNHIQESLSVFLSNQSFEQNILYTAAAFVVYTLLEQKLSKPELDAEIETEKLYALVDGLAMHRMMHPERLPAKRIESIIDQHLQGLCSP
ncbi:hypothetical protein FLT15_28715 [Paenibacillus thiaminolyticus]|nr:hypothetical protein [Paenibacillus thiaminolyticus]